MNNKNIKNEGKCEMKTNKTTVKETKEAKERLATRFDNDDYWNSPDYWIDKKNTERPTHYKVTNKIVDDLSENGEVKVELDEYTRIQCNQDMRDSEHDQALSDYTWYKHKGHYSLSKHNSMNDYKHITLTGAEIEFLYRLHCKRTKEVA